VVVVVGSVVVGAVVVGALVVVVGRDAVVVGAAVVAGRVVGGAVTAEVGGAAVGAAAGPAATVELVVDFTTVVNGVPILLPSPSPAATAAVVDAGHGRPPHSRGPSCAPNACNPSTSTIPAVATPVATHGRLVSHPPNPLPPREPPTRPRAGGGAAEFASPARSRAGNGSDPAASSRSERVGARDPATSGCRGPRWGKIADPNG
jgi:hypothetical protein